MAFVDKFNVGGVLYNVKDTATANTVAQQEKTIAEQGAEINKLGKDVSDLRENISKLVKVSVIDYGAKGDGVADDTKAIRDMLADVGYAFLPKGEFLVTDSIVISDGSIFGVGENSHIVMNAATNKPIIKASNRACIHDLAIGYTGKPIGGESDFVAIMLDKTPYQLQRTSIYNLHIRNVGTGIYQKYPDSPVFSVHFDTIEITDFSYAGIDILTSGSTNCTFTNIYINNNGLANVATYGFRLTGWMSSMLINSLNVEHGTYDSAIVIKGCPNLVAGVIHLENVKCKTIYNGLLTLSSVSGRIGSLSAYYVDTSTAGTGIVRLRNAKLWGDTDGMSTPIGNVFDEPCRIAFDVVLLDRLNVSGGGISNAKDFCVFQRLQEDASDHYTVDVKAYQYRPTGNDRDAYITKYDINFNDNIQFESKHNTPIFASATPDTRICSKYRTLFYDTSDHAFKIFNGAGWDKLQTQ